MSIFPDNVIEIIACVSVVQVHWQFILLRQVKVKREDHQLLLFRCVVKTIVVQATLADGDKSILHFSNLSV